MSLPFLTVRGEKIITETGKEIHLNGVNFANWLLWEGGSLGIVNYAEKKLRHLMETMIEKDAVDEFFNLIVQHHTTRDDFVKAKFEGLNVIRLPFHYRYSNPIQTDELYQAVEWAKEVGIYVILDMHAAPGGQAPAYFADCPGRAKLWESTEYQEEFFLLWCRLADTFKNEPTVAGYEILNEPAVNDGTQVRELYREAVNGIREIDRRHIVFLDGNHYAHDFNVFVPPFCENAVYVFHDYAENIQSAQNFLDTSRILDFKERYRVPVMCNEYNFRSEFTEFYHRQGIHCAPWCHQKLSIGWRQWIDSITAENQRLGEEHGLNEVVRKIRLMPKQKQRELAPALNAINQAMDLQWVNLMSDAIEKMSEDELTALTSGMRDRTGTQFVPESIRG